jgi:alkylation response protein AidB-like acyl-CoA dehydrogenase
MTERPGGSDVSGTETRASLLFASDIQRDTEALAPDGSPLGPWSVDGFKWFSSATDANMSVFLAKTESTDRVSLFFAPVRKQSASSAGGVEFNGVFPQRLKN